MKSLTQSIYESADKAYKEILGKTIKLNDSMKTMFNKLGMDFRHESDRFVVYEDGTVTYENQYLFTGVITAKVTTVQLNRNLKPSDKIRFIGEPVMNQALDITDTPEYYIRALLNALTHKAYTVDSNTYEVVINHLDYTSGDFEKDSK